jgi:hypothetical protein
MDNFDLRKYLAEGKLYEESIPSGWKKIDTSNDYEAEAKQGRLMGFEAPMNGIEGDEVDNIYIEQDEDEFEVHIMTAFNNPEYKGPFNSKEEALKVAIQKMQDLKKDWELNENKKIYKGYNDYFDKDSLLQSLGDADDAFIYLGDGKELLIYNPNSNNADNAICGVMIAFLL